MTIHVRNWEKFQHADVTKRGRPPAWIRLYTELLSDENYLKLTPPRRAMLIGIWVEYARTRRELPEDTASLSRRLAQRILRTDLEALNHAGFIEIRHANDTPTASLEERRGEVPPTEVRQRPKDHLWEALLQAIGRDPETTIERKRWNAALKELRDAGASPEDITGRASAYRREWPGVELTPHGLAVNWSRFGSSVVVLRPYECQVCGIGFTTESKLSDHLANVHDRRADVA